MKQLFYTFKELKNAISESNNFRPKIDGNIMKDDAKNNTEATKKIMSDVKKYNKLSDNTNNEKHKGISADDFNKTTIDYTFYEKPTDKYINRVKAQVNGYDSEESLKNSEEEANIDRDSNKEVYKSIKKRHDDISSDKQNLKHAGLKSHNLDKKIFKKNNMFKENKVKKLYFKHTKFLSEKNMIDRIPDSYKVDKNIFIMEDCEGTSYTVEWIVDEEFNYGHAKILSKLNEGKVIDDLNRIKNLFEYKPVSTETDALMRENENSIVETIINEARKM